ncbi:MAG: 30S ribosomal protein S18, partial [Microgenomates group bacterium]
MVKRKLSQRKQRPVPQNCEFCHQKKNPDFREVEVLRKYITERGKIMSKDRTGLCSKHQSRLATAIKRA